MGKTLARGGEGWPRAEQTDQPLCGTTPVLTQGEGGNKRRKQSLNSVQLNQEKFSWRRPNCDGRGTWGTPSVALCTARLVEVLLYVHRNRRFIRDGSPGRPSEFRSCVRVEVAVLGCPF